MSEPRQKRPRLISNSCLQLVNANSFERRDTEAYDSEDTCLSFRSLSNHTVTIELVDCPRPYTSNAANSDTVCVDDSETEDDQHSCENAAHALLGAQYSFKQHTLRISASRVAAAAGLHPFTDVADLFLEMLYQDLPDLLLRDAALVGVELVSPVAERARLISKSRHAEILEAAIQQAALNPRVDGVRIGHSTIRETIATAQKHGKLTADEAADLKKTLEKDMSMQFGTQHEDAAIHAYEAHFGCSVYGQQRRISIPLPMEREQALSQAFPTCPRSGTETAAETTCFQGSSGHPFFWLTGFVDGLVDISTDSQAEGRAKEPCASTRQSLQTLVVEVKHRVGRIKQPPDICDIIQLCSYCRALGCVRGDLVQVLRERPRSLDTGIGHLHRAQTLPSNFPVDDKLPKLVRSQSWPCMESLVGSHADGTFHVTRVDFREGSRDRIGWDERVLPALYDFASAVYAARSDDGLRYRLLVSDPGARTSLVEELCPHLAR